MYALLTNTYNRLSFFYVSLIPLIFSVHPCFSSSLSCYYVLKLVNCSYILIFLILPCSAVTISFRPRCKTERIFINLIFAFKFSNKMITILKLFYFFSNSSKKFSYIFLNCQSKKQYSIKQSTSGSFGLEQSVVRT